jgi:phage tail sheath protein FI
MAELTFKSAGVSTREIDLSGPTTVRPQGIPAGIIGTAQKGPAFVPITVATYADFVAEFGGTDGKKFGPLAMNEWMKNARAGTFVRVLGAGDAKKRDSVGRVTNAGFVVGAQLPQSTDMHDGGGLGDNPKAFDGGTQLHGRTYFLGALMREPYNSDGESAATSTVVFTLPLDPADFVDSGYGEGVRFADSTGADHLTIFFHEGADDVTDVDGGDISHVEDSRNIAVSVGNRAAVALTVADVTNLDNRVLQLTDSASAVLTLEFQDGFGFATAGALEASPAAATYVIDINGMAVAGVADMILSAANHSTIAMTAAAKDNPADAFFTIQLDDFGASADEPDGGTLTAAVPNVTLAHASSGVATTGFQDGVELSGAQIAQACVDRVAGLGGGLAAGLSLSVSGDDLVVTQGTVGIAGNEDDGTAGQLASVSTDWIHDVATITLGAQVHGNELTIQDLAATGAAGDSVSFVFDNTAVVNDLTANPKIISIAVAAANETELVIADPDGEWVDDDVVTIVELDPTDGTAFHTMTITFETAGVVPPSMVTMGDFPDIRADLGHADALGADNAAHILKEVFDDIVAHVNYTAAGGQLVTGDLVRVDDTLTFTQDAEVERADAVTATIALSEDNGEINTNEDAAITENERGHTAQTDAEIATVIATDDDVGDLDIRIDDDLAGVLTVEQAKAGPAALAALDAAGLVVEDATAGAGDFGTGNPAIAGGLPGGLAPGVFTGGGDAVESGPQHTSWEDAGIDTDSQSAPIIRAVLMTPMGVHPTLASLEVDRLSGDRLVPTAAPVVKADSGGSQLGLVELNANQERFTILLNGHTSTSANPSSLRCSFDPSAPDYFMNILNTDPTCLEHSGHYVYTSYDVHSAFAGVDTEGHTPGEDGTSQTAAFLVSGQNAPAPADADAVLTQPNYEDFQDRFQTANSPWVISQIFGSKPKNLFKIHALDDGAAGSGKFKITISNVMMGAGDEHGRFDLFVRDIADDDVDPRVYEKFVGLDLNPNSERYISRVIGDQFMYYDFDKRPGSQKLVVDGIHPQRSKYIRVEMAPEVDSGAVPSDALPLGYRGYNHLVTSHNNDTDAIHYLESGLAHCGTLGGPGLNVGSFINDAIEPPVPMRKTIAQGTGEKKRVQTSLCWGTMFQVMDTISNPNNSVKFNDSILSYGKYFPSFRTDGQPKPAVGNNAGTKPPMDTDNIIIGAELDSDKFNNNMFSLERIQVITKSPLVVQDANPQVRGQIDHKQWAVAEYRRNGTRLTDTQMTTLEGATVDSDVAIGTRFLDPKVDLASSTARRYMKFSFFLQGGFDGTNILNSEKAQLTNRAAVWEMDDANQGGTAGSTVASFRKAIDVMAERADVDIKLLVVPGMRDEAVTDYAIDAVEERFDAMYIMDIEERAVNNDLMIDYAAQKPSVNLTVEALNGRNLDSSFAAVYFPDVVITDPALGTNVQCPPSVAVLGAFSLNDSMAHPWFAPAGFSRGALKSVIETQVKLSRTNLDTLYESDVNPLAAFPHTPGVVVWGQKTLQRAQSALDRVNVRRLLIEIRREVRTVGNGLLFEPNRAETLGRFSAAVNPILQRIQQQQGLDKFKVVIDTTTTTQADIENNTVRGKIFLQPTRTVEFISLDFVVSNAGMEV